MGNIADGKRQALATLGAATEWICFSFLVCAAFLMDDPRCGILLGAGFGIFNIVVVVVWLALGEDRTSAGEKLSASGIAGAAIVFGMKATPGPSPSIVSAQENRQKHTETKNKQPKRRRWGPHRAHFSGLAGGNPRVQKEPASIPSVHQQECKRCGRAIN